MTISIQLNEEDSKFVTECAAINNLDPVAVAREALLERLEDLNDLRLANKAMEEYRKNPVTYTHEEVGRRLGLR